MQCTFLLLGTHENKNMTYSSVSRDAADLISLVRGRMLPSVRLFHLRLNGKYMNIIQSHCYIEYTTALICVRMCVVFTWRWNNLHKSG